MGNREALLVGAKRCLYEKGYARTTARDIVAAAESHLPSINYYFGSKEALLNAAIAETARRWLVRVATVAAEKPAGDPWEQMQALFDDLFEIFRENRGIIVSFFEALAVAERSEELRAQLAGFAEELRTAVKGLVEYVLPPEALERGAAPDVIATVLMALTDGLAIHWLIDPERTPDARQILTSLRAAADAS